MCDAAELSAPLELMMIKEPTNRTQDVQLEWSATASPPFRVLKGLDAATLRSAPESIFPGIPLTTFVDTGVFDPVTFYVVEKE